MAVLLVDVIEVLRLAEAGWPDHRIDFSVEAAGSARWNGYLDDAAKLTESGRRMLDKLGFLCPGVV